MNHALIFDMSGRINSLSCLSINITFLVFGYKSIKLYDSTVSGRSLRDFTLLAYLKYELSLRHTTSC